MAKSNISGAGGPDRPLGITKKFTPRAETGPDKVDGRLVGSPSGNNRVAKPSNLGGGGPSSVRVPAKKPKHKGLSGAMTDNRHVAPGSDSVYNK
jgi:hypothetical protein